MIESIQAAAIGQAIASFLFLTVLYIIYRGIKSLCSSFMDLFK